MYVHTEEVHNERASRVIVPDLIADFHPTSVIDVGCGIGTFLSVFIENNVCDVLGIDGPWVDREMLRVGNNYFMEADLENPPLFDRKFDMALCLEVAEHLQPSAADRLISLLCSVSKLVVFSAALPGQGGLNHLNEQLAEYWQEKFRQHDFHFFDIFRDRYWHDEEIDWWYKQNMFLAAHASAMLPPFVVERRVKGTVNTYVHPDPFVYTARELERLRVNLEGLKSVNGLLKTASRFARRKLFGR